MPGESLTVSKYLAGSSADQHVYTLKLLTPAGMSKPRSREILKFFKEVDNQAIESAHKGLMDLLPTSGGTRADHLRVEEALDELTETLGSMSGIRNHCLAQRVRDPFYRDSNPADLLTQLDALFKDKIQKEEINGTFLEYVQQSVEE